MKSPAPRSGRPPVASGSNTGTGAYRHSDDSDNLENTSGAGNLRMNWTGPISVVRFRYWCGGVGGGSNQLIRLGNISFDTCPENVTPNFAPAQPRQQAAELGPAPVDVVAPLPGSDR